MDQSRNLQTNTSAEYYNAIGLTPGEHTISMHTIDINGNINFTWVNDTASTDEFGEPIKKEIKKVIA